MDLEEIPTVTEDQTNPENPPNPNPRTPGGAVDEDTEEGEIVGEDDSSINKSAEIPLQPHQLEHSWTFWFDNLSAKSKHTAWGNSMRSIYTFATIEEFWSVFNNIRQPSQLAVGTDLYCFKHKIEPKWEDPVCSNGGDWTAAFTKGRSDKCWLYTLLAMIGEQFNHGDEICGAVVNVRARQERISLWTKNASNEAAQLSIGKQWKKFIDYDENIGFIFHEDAKILEKNAKSKYTI